MARGRSRALSRLAFGYYGLAYRVGLNILATVKRKSGSEALVKTSITIPKVLAEFADRQVKTEGYNSFSAYIAELVRADRRRSEEKNQAGPAFGEAT